MKSIKNLYSSAVQYLEENPSVKLSPFEVCMLHVSGAPMPLQSSNMGGGVDLQVCKAAIERMTEPFTAGNLAEALWPGRHHDRRALRAAGQAAREITGCGPRKSNGQSVYDPI